MPEAEETAKHLVQLVVGAIALEWAERQVQRGPNENRNYWIRVQSVLATRIALHSEAIRKSLPFQHFEWDSHLASGLFWEDEK